ncbi:hypothetical protein M427DRAFT_160370, partial [Gonapodya prolifera JEL478]
MDLSVRDRRSGESLSMSVESNGAGERAGLTGRVDTAGYSVTSRGVPPSAVHWTLEAAGAPLESHRRLRARGVGGRKTPFTRYRVSLPYNVRVPNTPFPAPTVFSRGISGLFSGFPRGTERPSVLEPFNKLVTRKNATPKEITEALLKASRSDRESAIGDAMMKAYEFFAGSAEPTPRAERKVLDGNAGKNSGHLLVHHTFKAFPCLQLAHSL